MPHDSAAPSTNGGHHDGMPADEYVLDTDALREFVAAVREAIWAAGSPPDACAAIRPRFAQLLADQSWLPDEYAAPAPESGMGGGIGQWLLFRAGDGSLSLFSLVVPSGVETPVHDHLAWGLVGLYRGAQDEEIYARRGGRLELAERRALASGDFYDLLPPANDIHRVRTTSAETSVSLHLLTNDTGCVWRHAYDPDTGEQRAFRSGYVNVDCTGAASSLFNAEDDAARLGAGAHDLEETRGEPVAPECMHTTQERAMSPTSTNGKICYIEIPATDVGRSAEFYSTVFGWRIRQRGDGRTAFDDTTGDVSGSWIVGRPPAADPGLLLYVMVDSVAAAIDAVVANGGEIVQPIGVDAPEITARFRDPAGNVVGLYQEPDPAG